MRSSQTDRSAMRYRAMVLTFCAKPEAAHLRRADKLKHIGHKVIMMTNRLTTLFISMLLLIATAQRESYAQASAFTYQGRLSDGGTPTNGNYDLQFALWNSLSGGAQVGSTQPINSVAVSNGVFTVNLDFGGNAFPGQARFLEIAVRPAGVGSFTTLTPRQPINSTPYAVRSLNAATADSVTVNGVPSGSGNYIQNTTTPQASTNFNVSGNGTVGGVLTGNIVNSTTQYNLNGSRILSTLGTANLFIGTGAGVANTGGQRNTLIGIDAGLSLAGPSDDDNTLVGSGAGRLSSSTSQNVFVGAFAGAASQSSCCNTFVGYQAATSNTTGTNNAFFGSRAAINNTTGFLNAAFGDQVALNNKTGNLNSFFGANAGSSNISGSENTFIGKGAGFSNSSGNDNTLLGIFSNVGSGNLSNATAIGAKAQVNSDNSLVLGSINGVGGATADTKVGIGTTTPSARLSIVATGDGAKVLHLGIERAWVFKQFDTGASTALELTADDSNNNNKNFLINTQGFVGIGTTAPTANLSVNGTANKPGGGSWGTFSDERLKTIRGHFTPGLQALMRLQPLRYEYKPDNALQLKSDGEHIGFSAQAVQEVIPEAVTKTDSGYLIVNNDPILWTMLNAIKEQQSEIQQQQKLIIQLKSRVARLERRRR